MVKGTERQDVGVEEDDLGKLGEPEDMEFGKDSVEIGTT